MKENRHAEELERTVIRSVHAGYQFICDVKVVFFCRRQ